MQNRVKLAGMGKVIAVKGIADILTDHLLHLLRSLVKSHDILPHERCIQLGQVLMLGYRGYFFAAQARHVFDIVQRDHHSKIPLPGSSCLTWINALWRDLAYPGPECL